MEIKKLKESIEAGDNLFISGSAGSGKTYIINHLIKSIPKKVEITASTGVAAVQIRGVTLHSWLNIGTGSMNIEYYKKRLSSGHLEFWRRKIKAAEILVIDEISMISGELFDLVDQVLRFIRGSHRPFGGLQMIVVGDFFQLPPVKGKEQNEVSYCFKAQSWLEADFKLVELKSNYRQVEHNFINILNQIRTGKIDETAIKTLNQCRNNSFPVGVFPTILTSHNYQVNNINNYHISQLSGSSKIYKAELFGDKSYEKHFSKTNIEPQLELKIGSQVMLLKNHLLKFGLTNGSIGVVEDFSIRGFPIVRFNNGLVKTISRESWQVEQFNQDSGTYVTLAEYRQLPLKLAWAISIHKSQGCTLEYVDCRLEKIFEYGQLYVALSRARSLQKLKLGYFNPYHIRANPIVIDFYAKQLVY